VVLDGGPQAEPSRASLNSIPIIHSGADQTADDVIASLAAKHGPGLTAITDDRELAARCRARGSQIISSSEFSDRLAMVFTMMDEIEPEEDEEGWDFTTKKKGPSHRLSKAQRRRKRRLDKL
jgi:predicted RNA-binding protein with PIN domain